jgi:c-di-GMP-binding flagellar brake protein YcgR
MKNDSDGGPAAFTIKARTINISGGGCKIAIKQPVDNNAKLECRISIGPNLDLQLDGQVVWVEKNTGEDRTNIIGVQFADADSAVQKQLVSFVTNEQRRQLKKNR